MYRVKIFITRKDNSGDDTILIQNVVHERDIFKVRFTTPEHVRDKVFLASERRAMDYIEDILYSLYMDTEPFENIQISTVIHPSIMFNIADLYEKDTRDLILNMCHDAIHMNVRNE